MCRNIANRQGTKTAQCFFLGGTIKKPYLNFLTLVALK